MDKGAYEIIKMLIQCTDQQIELELIDGTTRTLYIDPEKLLAELEKDQKLEEEANYLATFCADICTHVADTECCPAGEACVCPADKCKDADKPEVWRTAARKAVD